MSCVVSALGATNNWTVALSDASLQPQPSPQTISNGVLQFLLMGGPATASGSSLGVLYFSVQTGSATTVVGAEITSGGSCNESGSIYVAQCMAM